MCKVEKIVADYETCKAARGMGLRIDTIFKYDENSNLIITNGDYGAFWDSEVCSCFDPLYMFGDLIPAPTAEEVPLPMIFKIDNSNYCVSIDLERKCVFCNLIGFDYYEKEVIFFGGNFGSKFCRNEATARLQMATWLMENVPEAKQWYVDNGYLVEKADV